MNNAKKEVFRGSGVALVTPMHEDGAINYDMLKTLLDFHLSNNTDALILCGTTGESATLSAKERTKMIEFAVKHVGGRIPVVVGTGSNNTQTALELSLNAQELGADGLLIVTPYYNKTSQKGIVEHFTHIADRVKTPIILYNVPSRTGLNIVPETYKELSKHQNICATKEAAGDISAVAKIISLCGDDLKVYSGNDDQIVPMLSLGGIGVISVLANICPKETHNMVMDYLNSNIQKAAKSQLYYLKLINALFSDVNPIPVKEALDLMGYNCGKCRLPLVKMNDNAKGKLKDVLNKYGLI